MTKNFQQIISTHIAENRTGYLLSALYIFIGITMGAFVGTTAATDNSEQIFNFASAFNLHGAAPKTILLQSFYTNFRIFVLLWISGWFLWLYPINILELISKGFGIGYTSSYFISSMGIKGFFLSSISLCTQNFLIIPLLVIYSVIQLKFSVSFSKIRKSASAYKQKKRLIGQNILTLIVILTLIFLCSMSEAYVIPKFITIICCDFA